ncbi:TlyA family RNA methyltransferase [Magnetofaba australis]|uniref:Putative hemolysin A n=1 Tax=Magnetofaba australis IT-1 TaxID=1434232 RepID=A0A1Y2K6N3_9PROT|nr:TlyA family RNA methyltransferase [Magnetofaba australis]OSM05322.1 putative hemolysin A [Magnetofaba australis IT-1]
MPLAKPPKRRFDELLLAAGLAEDLKQAQSFIMTGKALVDDRPVVKPGQLIRADAALRVKGVASHPWVSRGGVKLAHALDHFAIDPANLTAIDLGASTGGFTDVLLQRGARRVYAVDVGYGQLAWKLVQDPRVVNLERCNARELDARQIPDPIDLLVCDASFIPLRVILPAALALLKPGGHGVVLIKPQFEASKAIVDAGGGVVRDTAEIDRCVQDVTEWMTTQARLRVLGVSPSPITGPKGNQEQLCHFENENGTERSMFA